MGHQRPSTRTDEQQNRRPRDPQREAQNPPNDGLEQGERESPDLDPQMNTNREIERERDADRKH